MYQAVYYNRRTNEIHLWDDEQGYEKFQYEKYAYIVDKNGPFLTMDGIRVKKTAVWSKEAETQGLVYEHDVPVLTRILVDRYYQYDEVSKDHRIMFLDIEVAKEGKHSTPREAANTITAISYYLRESGYTCLLLDKNGLLKPGVINVTTTSGQVVAVNLNVFRNESSLLSEFVCKFSEIRPTIVSHWNGDTYDMPYLVNRITKILGTSNTNKLSEIGIVYTEDVGKRDQRAIIAGVVSLDYMVLYKKFSENDRPRHTLNFICNLELGRGKKQFQGTLDELYEKDPSGFVEYNIDDVELVVALDKKFDYIEIARGLCHAGCVPYEDIIYSTRYLEGASLVHCKKHGIIAMTTHTDEAHSIAKGAFVRSPKPGLFKYVCSVDLQSQYPTSIISQNVSPETKFGRIVDWDKEDFARDVARPYLIQPKRKRRIDFDYDTSDSEFVVDDLRKWLSDNQMCVSAIGVIYRMDKIGLIPDILSKWFDERKRYKNLRDQYEKNSELYESYDRRQYLQKILLNSFYGAMLERNFRFYDKENGESTTQTGYNLIQFTSNVINLYCRSITKKPDDYVIYNDTDSAYFVLDDVINTTDDTNSMNEELVIQKLQYHSKRIEDLLNKSYEKYAIQYHNLKRHRWKIVQEKIARKAFWGAAKKRYAMWVIVNEGVRCEKPMIKGFDSVRSDFPQLARDFMEKLIIDILKDNSPDVLNGNVINFKKTFQLGSILDILPPSGVKEISKYQNETKGVPIHVNSSKNYNKLLKLLHLDAEYPPIEDGDKVLWGYLRQNPYNFNSLAIRGYDDPPQVVEYMNKYIDRDKIFTSVMVKKLQTIWDDLNWGVIQLEEQHDDFF